MTTKLMNNSIFKSMMLIIIIVVHYHLHRTACCTELVKGKVFGLWTDGLKP